MSTTKVRDIINIVLGIMVIAALVFSLSYRLHQAYEATYDTWRVKTINGSFAIVTNTEKDVLARNPVHDLEPGDKIILRGYGLSELPYIYSKVNVIESTTTP